MKIIKGLGLFSVLVLATSACFDRPEYPNTPHIELESLRFYSAANGLDSLVLSLSFEDGDGDLGLSTDEFEPPFHPNNFYLGNNGTLTPIATFTGQTNETPPRLFPNILRIEAGQTGRLVTSAFNQDPKYPTLPEDIFPATCLSYKYQSVWVSGTDLAVINNGIGYNIVDTITNVTPRLYEVKETLYYTDNPNYENITVEFWVLNAQSQFELLDWRTISPGVCGLSFDGRFMRLSSEQNPLAGTLRYSMKSAAMAIVLGGSTFKLKVRIRDRALNVSNEIDTGPNNLTGLR